MLIGLEGIEVNKKDLVQAAFKMGMKQNDGLMRKLAEVEKEELLRKKGQGNNGEGNR